MERFQRLSNILRAEQLKLLEEAADCGGLPSNNILKQIAELELNITAVENNLIEMDIK